MGNEQPRAPKELDKSKTMIINGLLLLIALVPDVQMFFEDMGWSIAWVIPAMAALNMGLRLTTKGPVARRLFVLRQSFRWFTGRKPK